MVIDWMYRFIAIVCHYLFCYSWGSHQWHPSWTTINSGCSSNSHTITIDPDPDMALLQVPAPWRSTILNHTTHSPAASPHTLGTGHADLLAPERGRNTEILASMLPLQDATNQSYINPSTTVSSSRLVDTYPHKQLQLPVVPTWGWRVQLQGLIIWG